MPIVEASHKPLKRFPIFKVILGFRYLWEKRPVKAVNVQPRAVVDIPEVIRHFLPEHRKFVNFLLRWNSKKLLRLQRHLARRQQERKQNKKLNIFHRVMVLNIFLQNYIKKTQ